MSSAVSNDATTETAERTTGNRVVYGVLKDGTRFVVPNTMSVWDTLTTPKSWKSPTTLIWICSWVTVGLTGILYFKGVLPVWYFCLQFAFWRLAYNIGIGCILYGQSKSNRFLQFYRWVMARHPKMRHFLEASVVFEDSTAYAVDKFPDEFSAWMLFRQVENVVLANDLVSYIVLAIVCWGKMSLTSLTDICCFLVGSASIVFALWSKADAHRVVGDFAWYWGDFFFLVDQKLIFDGIFQMFPHPMYTVGYAFMYGVPIMAKSYTLFYMSVFGHLCQIAFLAFVENPHIDRTYNELTEQTEEEKQRNEILYGYGDKSQAYLKQNELVVLMNFNIFRASDLLLAVVLVYLTLALCFPIPAWVFVVHCVLWRVFHNGALGYVLAQEARTQWFSRHYDSPQHAFSNWKRIYNASVTITNFSYCMCALKLFSWSMPLIGGGDARFFICVIGALLIALNAYVSYSIYTTVGDFGYFYGDFFVRDTPWTLNYSGIYRYLNNPDSSLGMSAFYGVAFISGSPVVFAVAIFSHIATKTFEVLVEQPHLRLTYGSQVHEDGGLQRELKRRLQNYKSEYERGVQRLKETFERTESICEDELKRMEEASQKVKTN